MNQEEQVKINEKSRTYDIKLEYHSDLCCENYDVEILAIQESDGKISFKTGDGRTYFEFVHSDPDRVIAIATMLWTFAKTMKKH